MIKLPGHFLDRFFSIRRSSIDKILGYLNVRCFLLTLLCCCNIVFANEPIVQNASDAMGMFPAYISLAALREDATLRSVAVSETGVLVAVGDHGTILRSEDEGDTWQAVACPTHVQLRDLAWLEGDRWIAIGGGYEPVTGVSHGFALLSDDAGFNWRVATTDNVTKLRRLVIDQVSKTIRAIGDTAESSGVNRFQTLDAGEHWVEDSVPLQMADAPTQPADSSLSGFSVAFHDVISTSTGCQIAVGDHGVIVQKKTSGADAFLWHSVRGSDRRTAILFVAASAGTVPWSVLGRESCEEGQRCGLLIDAGDSWPSRSMPMAQQDRIEQATTMIGAAFARSIARSGNGDISQVRFEQLQQLRPVVLVLDANLRPEVMSDWQRLVQRQISESGDGVASVFVSDLSADESKPSSSGTMLRGDALLPTTARLAADLHRDGLMIADPGREVPSAVTTQMLPLGTRIGSDRRSGSLAGGLVLSVGCLRTGSIEDAGSRRRLQITTARLSMQRRLDTILADADLTADQLTPILDSMLLTTAIEDRSRLMWSLIERGFSDKEPRLSDECLDVLLQRTQVHAPEPGLRRWAELKRTSRNGSGERRLGSVNADWSVDESPVQSSDSFGTNPALSPFQIQPVGYETHIAAITPVLVPAMQSNNVLPLYREAITRSNWEYHPTVLAARSVQAGTESTQADSPLPIHPSRPVLDARLADSCWPVATWWLDGECHVGLVSDGDYAYLAVLVPTDCELLTRADSHRLRLGLDIDNDPLTHFQIETKPNDSAVVQKIDGRRQSTVQPTLLVATKDGQIVGGDGTYPWQVVAEMAIEITTLHRFAIHTEIVGRSGAVEFSPMPLPNQFRSFVHPRFQPPSKPLVPSTK